MPSLTIVDAAPLLPDVLTDLVREAHGEGLRIPSRVVEQWRDATMRFDGAGEAVLVALDDQHAEPRAIAIGGLTRCPHVDGALRMRRFYVAQAWRRLGVGRQLGQRLIAQAWATTTSITCNAQASSAAAPFWERLGFEPTTREGITHVLTSPANRSPDLTR